MEVTSTELCFYYSSGEGKHSSAAPHMQLKIFWVTPHTAWSPSLLDLFSTLYCTSYNIPFPLWSMWIITCMLYEPATGYSKITTVNNRTRARLLQLSNNLQEQLTTKPTPKMTNEPTLLQYKIYPFIGSLKVLPLQHCGPIPTVTQTLISDSRPYLYLR